MVKYLLNALLLCMVTCCHGVDYKLNPETNTLPPAYVPDEPGWEEIKDVIIAEKDQPPTTILVVVDNSSSMLDNQTTLMQNVPNLIRPLMESGVPFHFGVTTTDTETPAQCGLVNWIVSRGTITPDAFIMEAADLIQVGLGGSGNEKGTHAIRCALQKTQTANLGFFLPGPIHILVISDDKDHTSSEWDDDFNSLMESIETEHKVTSFSAITKLEVTDSCGETFGPRYLDLVIAFNGYSVNICSSDWSEPIREIAADFLKQQTTFYLSREPENQDKIEVSVIDENYTIIPEEWQWQYLRSKNAIEFLDFPIEKLGTVVIEYTALQ